MIKKIEKNYLKKMLNYLKKYTSYSNSFSLSRKIYKYNLFNFTETERGSDESQNGQPPQIPITTKLKFNVLFFGNDEISLPSVAKIYEESFNDNSIISSLGVVTTPLRNKKSTQSIFHKFINDKRIEKYELNNTSQQSLRSSWREINEKIKEKQYNLGVIASFGKMLPGSIITSLKHGAYVMHPSLLPKYRGAAPIQHSLLNDESKTGISIAEASISKFDAGDIILQKEVEIEKFHRFKELSLVLSHLGGSSVIEFLKNYEEMQNNKKQQIEDDVTHAKLIVDNNYVYMDFLNESAKSLNNLYRAFYGSQIEPYTKAVIEGRERLLFFENLFVVTETSSVYKLQLSKIEKNATPGVLYWNLKEDRNNIYIRANDKWLVTNKIKFDGTAYLPGETAIVKFFKNKVYKDKANTQFNIITSQNKNKILNLNQEVEKTINIK